MDRRTFLKTITTLGVSMALPMDLKTASQEEIDTTWRLAARIWDLFEVDGYGTLSYANFEEPRLRRELYWYSGVEDFGAGEVENCFSLKERIKSIYREEVLRTIRLEEGENNTEAIEDQVDEEWFDWFDQADGTTREALNTAIEAWLDEEPEWDNEWEQFYKKGTAQGAAYDHFLSVDKKLMKALGIVIIEGDCPGSSYFAAELRIPVDKANQIAEQNGWNIRFVTEGLA